MITKSRIFTGLIITSAVMLLVASVLINTKFFGSALVILIFFVVFLFAYIVFAWIEYPVCSLCGSSDRIIIGSKDRLSMARCKSCSLTYAYPRYALPRRWLLCQFWSYKDAFDPGRLELSHGHNNLVQNIRPKLEILKNCGYPGKGNLLLDIGCSTGAFMIEADIAGFKCEGIEPGFFSSKYGKNIHKLNIHNANVESYMPNRQFDVITCLHVLEHVTHTINFMTALRYFLKDEGLLLIATPNVGCKYAREMGMEWEAVGPADHVCLFDSTTITELLNNTGFKIQKFFESGTKLDELVAVCEVKICRDNNNTGG